MKTFFVATYISRLFSAVQFLTVIPYLKLAGSPYSENNEIGKSAAFFPVAGLIIGIALWVTLNLLSASNLSSILQSSLLLALLVILTGGLHLDGLADTFDAMASGWDKNTALEIMKQGTVGAMGVVAIVLVLLIKFAAMNSLISFASNYWIIVFPVVARWAMVSAMTFYPPAKEEGLGQTFIKNCTVVEFAIATLITFLVAIMFFNATITGTLMISTMAMAVIASLLTKHKFGGLTGDSLGMICELSEAVALIILLIV